MNYNGQNDSRRQGNGTQGSGKLRQYIAEAERNSRFGGNARFGGQNEIQKKITAAQAEAEQRQRVDAELERLARENVAPTQRGGTADGGMHPVQNTQNAERKNGSVQRRPARKEPEEELTPFLGYYPLAGRTTYIGQHKKRRRTEKIIAILLIILVILVIFVIFRFGGEIAEKLFPLESTEV